MKHQQVSVDVGSMVFSACSYLALAGAVWIFLRLVQACFWLPRRLRNENNIERMLEDKVSSYEKYVTECEEKERAMELEGSLDLTEEGGEKIGGIEETRRWKDRRECLDMLKKELRRIRDGGDPYDWDHLLDEEEKKLLFGDTEDEEEEEAVEGAGEKPKDGKVAGKDEKNVDKDEEKVGDENVGEGVERTADNESKGTGLTTKNAGTRDQIDVETPEVKKNK